MTLRLHTKIFGILLGGILILGVWAASFGFATAQLQWPQLDSSQQDLTSLAATSPSWNPAVSCKAVVLTVEALIGQVPNPTQLLPNVGADYSGGALQLAGVYPPGSNPDTVGDDSVWPYWKRDTNPPCSVTLPDGRVLPTFVEIHGVKVLGLRMTEVDGDTTFNIGDPKLFVCSPIQSPLCPNTYPDTMHRVHVEIDIAWKNAGIAPPFTNLNPGDIIDIQGFVYWDDKHLADGWHSYSGWEIHPVSAWRLSEPFGVGV